MFLFLEPFDSSNTARAVHEKMKFDAIRAVFTEVLDLFVHCCFPLIRVYLINNSEIRFNCLFLLSNSFVVLAGAASEERSELHFTHQRNNLEKITPAVMSLFLWRQLNNLHELCLAVILNHFSCITITFTLHLFKLKIVLNYPDFVFLLRCGLWAALQR